MNNHSYTIEELQFCIGLGMLGEYEPKCLIPELCKIDIASTKDNDSTLVNIPAYEKIRNKPLVRLVISK